jgi:hypothetical protein
MRGSGEKKNETDLVLNYIITDVNRTKKHKTYKKKNYS